MNCGATLLAVTLAATAACGPRNPADVQVVRPNKIMDFNVLYARNCSGCHGPDGKGGAAIELGDPVYLAIADNAILRRVTSEGVAGTSMPAFAQHSGGMLADDQINVIVQGMRARWAKPAALGNTALPPYAAPSPGDPKRGAEVYGTYCSSCHGPDGHGGKAGSIVDPAYLALISDQGIRTNVIVGRPALGSPDWRSDVPGKVLSPADISDVVAWLAAQRPQVSAQVMGRN
jgi:mono/diheme cytochrome c family protein